MFGSMEKKRFLVCGLGVVGRSVADNLDRLNYYVVGIDIKEEIVSEVRNNPDYNFLCFQADVQNKHFLEDLGGLQSFDVAIITIGDLLSRVVCAKMLQQQGVKHIIARAASPFEEDLLTDLHVERFEHVKEDLGRHMAHISVAKHILDYDVLNVYRKPSAEGEVARKTVNYCSVNVLIPEQFVGDSIATFKKKLSFSKRLHVLAVYDPALEDGENNPCFCKNENFSEQVLAKDSTLIITGPDKEVENLIKEIAKLAE